MKNKLCSKIDTCYKIDILRDKDMLDSQFAEAVKDVCAKCDEFTTEKAKEDRLLKDEEMLRAGRFKKTFGEQYKAVAQSQLAKDLEWEAKTAEVVRGEIADRLLLTLKNCNVKSGTGLRREISNYIQALKGKPEKE